MKKIKTYEAYTKMLISLKGDTNKSISIKKDDIVSGGKFKNKKVKVKSINMNGKGDITINGKPYNRFRKTNEDVDEYTKEYNLQFINHSYNDYKSTLTIHKEAMARQIVRTAKGFINNGNSLLSDWIDKFKDEEIVMKEFKPLIFEYDVNKYNL